MGLEIVYLSSETEFETSDLNFPHNNFWNIATGSSNVQDLFHVSDIGDIKYDV